MKNFLRMFGIIASIVMIGIVLLSCDDKVDNDPISVTYTSYDADGNEYTLVITKNTNRAAYIPQSGDIFVLTIKNSSGIVVGKSTGSVATVSGTTFSLQKGSDTFTVTIYGSAITTISDNIPLDDGSTKTPPDILTPNKPLLDESGMFTLTNIPNKYNGKYAFLCGFMGSEENMYEIYGAQNIAIGSDIIFVQIDSGKVSLPLQLISVIYDYDEDVVLYDGDFFEYFGSDTIEVYFIITNKQTSTWDNLWENLEDAEVDFALEIMFSNGKASKTWIDSLSFGSQLYIPFPNINRIFGPGSNDVEIGYGLNYSTEQGVGWSQTFNGIYTTAYCITRGNISDYISTDINREVIVTVPENCIIEVWDLETFMVISSNYENPGTATIFTALPNHRYGGYAWYSTNEQKELGIIASFFHE